MPPKRCSPDRAGAVQARLRRDLNVQIEDFGANAPLKIAVHDYYRLLKDFGLGKQGHFFFILRNWSGPRLGFAACGEPGVSVGCVLEDGEDVLALFSGGLDVAAEGEEGRCSAGASPAA